jgi:hypothetical protein
MPTSQIYEARSVLTNAQIKSLVTDSTFPDVGREIVPAPGAGKDLVFLSGVLLFDAAAGAYTNIDAAYAVIGFKKSAYISSLLVNDTTPTPDLTNVTEALTQANVMRSVLVPYTQFYNADYGLISYVAVESQNENTPITINAENGAGDFTGGHASNSLTAIVHYTIIDV